jgi:hypothetical protein
VRSIRFLLEAATRNFSTESCNCPLGIFGGPVDGYTCVFDFYFAYETAIGWEECHSRKDSGALRRGPLGTRRSAFSAPISMD